jgi:LuxR family maltose regulon positive regulatory protein
LCYVAAAFETIDPVLAEGLASMLDATQSPPLEALVTQLINNLAQVQQSILLVLDDYHTISSESIHESLNLSVLPTWPLPRKKRLNS